ncbi:MAG: hypothetical protein ABSB41_01965 [Anaerolineales bacterium]|jgi:hypothetical protein
MEEMKKTALTVAELGVSVVTDFVDSPVWYSLSSSNFSASGHFFPAARHVLVSR